MNQHSDLPTLMLYHCWFKTTIINSADSDMRFEAVTTLVNLHQEIRGSHQR
jgi:hypothetical protein